MVTVIQHLIISISKPEHKVCDVFKKDTEISVAVGLLLNKEEKSNSHAGESM